jgi:hypothetical protein
MLGYFDLPSPIWKIYWRFQRFRCLLGWHDWYDVCAGEASACLCGADGDYRPDLMHAYRWHPRIRALVARAEEAEDRAAFWQGRWIDELKDRDKSITEE